MNPIPPARAPGGRFAKGNPGGPGNPRARQTAAIRRAVASAVTPDDLQVIVRRLVDMAKGGNLAAIHELLNRVIGKPKAYAGDGDDDHLDRIVIETVEATPGEK